MRIRLSDHFTYRKILAFALPSVMMMIFTSIYCVVDGFFISNFVGITEFAAINLIMPLLQIFGCFGFMLGAGGSALVSKTLGEGDRQKANRIFSLLVYAGIILGAALAAIGCLVIEPVAVLMGADENLLPYCVTYGRIIMIATPAFMCQNMFQSFLIAAERPGVGLAITIIAGCTNMGLDALFVAVFQWGVVGAAVATVSAQAMGGIIPLIYFIVKRRGLLYLGKTAFDGRALWRTCTNGVSELVSNISMSVVSILYNFQLMRIAGETGVAAYGAVMYVGFALIAIFIGYSISVAPVVGYHYGAGNTDELKSLFKKSNILIAVSGLIMSLCSYVFSSALATFFLGREAVAADPVLMEMTVDAFHCFALSVVFSGFSIFGSSFFTALNNGGISAAISFLRTMVFQVATVIVLPIFFGIEGVWYSLLLAEVFATVFTVLFFILMRKKYHYA